MNNKLRVSLFIVLLLVFMGNTNGQKPTLETKSIAKHNSTGTSEVDPGKPGTRYIGTWIFPWWVNKTDYIWQDSFGGGAGDVPVCGDVNGDGRHDAVLLKADGSAWVALSDGWDFSDSPARWLTDFQENCKDGEVFCADVNGDGKDDFVAVKNSRFHVALSDGTSFVESGVWTADAPRSGNSYYVGDVNADGKSDLVYRKSDGGWYFSVSKGNGGGAWTLWGNLGASTYDYYRLGDVNGDSRADVIQRTKSDTWSVALATSLMRLQPKTVWATGWQASADFWDVGELVWTTGRADLVTFDKESQEWWAAYSQDSKFGTDADDAIRPFELSRQQLANWAEGMTHYFVKNIHGDDDKSVCAYSSATGQWRGQGAYYYRIKNRWEAKSTTKGISLGQFTGVPLKNGQPWQYCLFNEQDIDAIIEDLASAKIDLVLFDQTNTLLGERGTLFEANKIFAQRLAAWNAGPNNRKVRYCLALGHQLGVEKLFYECETVLAELIEHPVRGGRDNYLHLGGKPLMVLYAVQAFRDKVFADPNHATRNKFTWLHAEGPTVSTSDGRGFVGWFNTIDGPVADDRSMFVTPRYPVGYPENFPVGVGNFPEGIFCRSFDFYQNSWDRVISIRPDVVVVGSYDLNESNRIGIIDDSRMAAARREMDGSNPAPDKYWNETLNKIDQLLLERNRLKEPYEIDFPTSEGCHYRVYALDGSVTSVGQIENFNSIEEGTYQNTFDEQPGERAVRAGQQFGLIYEGFLTIPRDDYYIFLLSSVDGSQLQIDGKIVANNDGHHDHSEAHGAIALAQGCHPFKLFYFGTGGSSDLSINVEAPHMSITPLSDLDVLRVSK